MGRKRSDAEVITGKVSSVEDPSSEELPVGDVDTAASAEGKTPAEPPATDGVFQYHCGVRGCRPKWLQVFAKANFFTFILCLNSLVEGAIVSGFTPVVISSIEKRYRFSSTAASLIVSTFDVTVVCAAVFVSYFGEKGHKPRWLGISLILQGIGTFVFALPKFLFGNYEVGSNINLRLESCVDGNDHLSDCDPANSVAYACFILGTAIIAIGATALFTIGTTYLDDIVYPKKVSIHLGLFYSMAVIGPAIGFGLGGAFLSVYVDPWETTDLEESDPGWVGAWWICFVFSGIISLLLAIPFLMYPRLLPDSHLVMEERRKEMAKKYTAIYGEEKTFWEMVKSFPRHLRKLVKNPTWVFVTIAIATLFLSLDGMVAFGPKYFETMFGLPPSVASITVGAIAIPAGGAGVLTGAAIMHGLGSKGYIAVRMHLAVSVLAIAPIFAFLAYCNSAPVAGISAGYPNGQSGDVVSLCNQHCNCTSTIFEPVCGADDLTYFSPCRAGCDKYFRNGDESNPVFENCSCIAEGLGGPNTSFVFAERLRINGTADSGLCEKDCTLTLVVFVIGIFAMIFTIFLLKVPTIIVTIRCVADEQRTLSLGVQSTIFRAFGSVPGPIIFGVIFDSACVYWQYECGRRGNCWVYDNEDLSVRAFSIGVTGVSVNCLFSFLTWLFYPRDRDNDVKASESDSIPKGSLIKRRLFSGNPSPAKDVEFNAVFSGDPSPAKDVEFNAVYSGDPTSDNGVELNPVYSGDPLPANGVESDPIEMPNFGDVETTVVSL